MRRSSKKAIAAIVSATAAITGAMISRTASGQTVVFSVASGDYAAAGSWTGSAVPASGASADVNNGGTCLINASDGAITISQLWAGDSTTTPKLPGVISQSGDTVTATTFVAIGHGGNATGTYNLSGGTLNETGSAVGGTTGIRIFGNTSSGAAATTFLMSGSSTVINDAGTFDVGYGTGTVGSGEMLMSGGTINMTNTGAAFAVANTTVAAGSGVVGIFSMTGGTFNGSSQLWVGEGQSASTTGANGMFQISGGSVASSNYVVIGRGNSTTVGGATGVMNISGGTFTHIANTLGISGASADFQVGGQGINSTATLNLLGGALITDHISDASTSGTQTINFNGGILQANASDNAFIRPFNSSNESPNLAVGNGGAIFNTGTFTDGLLLPLNHSSSASTIDGGLTKYGSGVLSLSGVNTYTGPTVVNAGTLNVLGSIASTSLVAVNNGAAIGSYNASGAAVGTISGTVLFNGSSTLTVNPTGAQYLTVGGSVNGSGASVNVLPTINTAPALTPVVVLDARGGILGTYGSAGSGDNFVAGVRGTLTEQSDGSGGTDLVLTAASSGPGSLVWKGNTANPTYWDVQTTPNWFNTASSSSDLFYENDNVTFDDTANSFTVAIQANVIPTSVTFNNSSNNYTVTGPGGISGATGLTKLGGKSVLITSANSYTGSTLIQNGTLQLGSGGSLNASTSVVLGSGSTSGIFVLGNSGGAVSQTIAGLTTSGIGSTNEVIGGSSSVSTLTVNVASGTDTYPGLLGSGTPGASNANSMALTKAGAGLLVLSASNTYTGGTAFTGGTISINSGSALGTGPISWLTTGVGAATNVGSGTILATSSVNLANNFSIGTGAAVFNTSGNTITLSGSITNTAGTVAQVMQPIGGGYFILGGTFNVSGSPTDSNNPALLMASPGETTTITGSGNLSGISLGWYSSSNTLIIQPSGTLNLTNNGSSLYSGQTAGGNGFLIQNSGTINLSGNLGLAAWDGSFTTFVINGGTLNVGGGFAANSIGNGNDNSYIQMSGGVVNVSGQTKIGFNGTGTSTLYMTGGTFNSPGANFIVASAPGSTAVVTVAGGLLSVVNLNIAANSQNTSGGAILNLDGSNNSTGTVLATSVKSTSAGAYSIVNFNGGVLQAGNLSPNLLNFVNQANVFSGGATFNSAGNTVTIPQNLVGAALSASMGINTAPALNSGGSGYIGIPAITITGGGGTGATAVATVSGQTVTGVTITNPGTGYSSAPSINFIGANGSGAAFAAAPSANAADGGVTKIGAGTLTLSGNNSYTGGTFVKGGTLAVANSAALGSGAVTMSNQTTLALAALPQLTPFTGFAVNTATPGAGSFRPVLSDGGNGTSALLTSSLGSEATSIFSPSEFTISDTTGFAASFIYNHGNLGGTNTVSANGVAFVIQNSPVGTAALNASAGALGYGGSGSNASSPGILNSVAAAVDVWDNQLQVGQNGFLNTSTGLGSVPFISQAPACQVTINYSYNALAGTGTLTETIASLSNTSSYTVLASLDVPQLLGGTAGGTGQGYIGFTGSTGGVSDAQMISNFSFTNTASTLTPLATNISNPVVVLPSASTTLTLAATNLYSSGSVGPITLGAGGTLAVSIGSNAATGVVHGRLTTPSITFGSGSTLDVTANALDITTQAGTPSASLAAIWAQVATGYSGGDWNGSGIVSSIAAGDSTHLTAIGVIINDTTGNSLGVLSSAALYTSFDGASAADGDILVKYTYYGDANLDGKIDGSDYALIDNGFSNGLTGWYNGDFNYDGVVNGSDYTLIDNTFNTQGAQLSAQLATATAQIGGAASAVPEPTAMALFAIGASALLGRRRQRNCAGC